MAFNRVQIDGGLLAGAERWSCGVAFATPGGEAVVGPVELSDWAENIRAALGGAGSFVQPILQCLGSNGSIDRVRTYRYVSPGTPAVEAGVSTGASIPGQNSVVMPPQCSVVASLLTGRAGRSYRGRFYWPRLTGSLSAGGKISGIPTTVTLAVAFADMLESMAVNSGLLGLAPVVVSSAGGGAVTAVTQVSVGDVVDTQRRRRDGLIEIRSVAPVVI